MDMHRYEILRHQQGFINTTGADQRLLGPNDKRRRIIFSPPITAFPANLSRNKTIPAVSTATTGVKLSSTVGSGESDVLVSASFFTQAGAAVVAALQVNTGGNLVTVAQFTTAGTFTGQITLAVGDVVQWNVITAVAASTADFGLYLNGVSTPNLNNRVTFGFGQAAVLDNGLTIHQGTAPFSIVDDDMMRAIREEIRVIGNVSGLFVGFEEFYGI